MKRIVLYIIMLKIMRLEIQGIVLPARLKIKEYKIHPYIKKDIDIS
jgi:hypothetical protein